MLFLQRMEEKLKEILGILKNSPLFIGIEEENIEFLLQCLLATEKSYKKNQSIFMAGEKANTMGIVLTGKVHVVQEDFWGNRNILANIGEGELFGETFSCSQVKKIPVSVIAIENSKVLLVDYLKVITTCPTSCVFHTRLIQNMVEILAQKNVLLTRKMEILTKGTTREKLLAYLSLEAQKKGRGDFLIPFNRQELADYLSVDRSALSKELSKMQGEGILHYKKNFFELMEEKE